MKNQIIDYRIAYGNTLVEMTECVKENLLKGYQPHGSMVVNSDSRMYMQPMVMFKGE